MQLTPLNKLPLELVCYIDQYLTPLDWVCLRQSCKSLNCWYGNVDAVWRRKLEANVKLALLSPTLRPLPSRTEDERRLIICATLARSRLQQQSEPYRHLYAKKISIFGRNHTGNRDCHSDFALVPGARYLVHVGLNSPSVGDMAFGLIDLESSWHYEKALLNESRFARCIYGLAPLPTNDGVVICYVVHLSQNESVVEVRSIHREPGETANKHSPTPITLQHHASKWLGFSAVLTNPRRRVTIATGVVDSHVRLTVWPWDDNKENVFDMNVHVPHDARCIVIQSDRDIVILVLQDSYLNFYVWRLPEELPPQQDWAGKCLYHWRVPDVSLCNLNVDNFIQPEFWATNVGKCKLLGVAKVGPPKKQAIHQIWYCPWERPEFRTLQYDLASNLSDSPSHPHDQEDFELRCCSVGEDFNTTLVQDGSNSVYAIRLPNVGSCLLDTTSDLAAKYSMEKIYSHKALPFGGSGRSRVPWPPVVFDEMSGRLVHNLGRGIFTVVDYTPSSSPWRKILQCESGGEEESVLNAKDDVLMAGA